MTVGDHFKPDLAALAGGAVGLLMGVWVGLGPLVQVLLVLMLADVLTGMIAAGVNNNISSASSRRGLARKAATLIVVLVVGWMGESTSVLIGTDLPAGQALAGAFCMTELVSMLENAQRAGVDIGPFSRVLAIAKPSALAPRPTLLTDHLTWRPVVHLTCGRTAFLTSAPNVEGETIEAAEAIHTDGRPIDIVAPVACDACGALLDGVRVQGGAWVTQSAARAG